MKRKVFLLIILVLMLFFFNCSDVEKSDLSNRNTNFEINKNKSDGNDIARENFKLEWQREFEKTAAQLQKNQQLWEEKHFLNYNFVIQKSAPGQPVISKGAPDDYRTWVRLPVLIKVRNGEKFSIEKVEKGEDTIVSRTDGFEDFDTIDKFFKFLRHELEKGRMLDIDFNKKLGYPESANIKGSYEIHGYVSIVITKLERTIE